MDDITLASYESTMTLSIIVAVAENNVIGKDNDLVWNLPDDMKYFMNTTQGHHVIMGRKNYESIPSKYRPLPGRINIVITHQENYKAPGCTVVHSLDEAIASCNGSVQTEVFVIGGGQIYQMALKRAAMLYITEVKTAVDGDAFFPDFDKSKYEEVSRVHHPADSKHLFAFDFVKYRKL